MLGNLHLAAEEYEVAQTYFERALAACRGAQATAMQERISTQLRLYQAHTMSTTRRSPGSGLGGLSSQFQRFQLKQLEYQRFILLQSICGVLERSSSSRDLPLKRILKTCLVIYCTL